MGLDELLTGRELILKHNNNIKDLPSKGLKEYCPNNSWLEKKQIEVQLEERYNFIKAERIEKSNSVAQAQWIPHLKKAKLTKHFGKLWETLGHHQDNEDWLLPEEALFLIENSELQLLYKDISLSVEDCYELVFNEGGCSLDEYKVFSYLCRAGYRVIRHSSAVRVTQYEKQVRLDTIVQSQKRDAPEAPKKAEVTDLNNKDSVKEEGSIAFEVKTDKELAVASTSKVSDAVMSSEVEVISEPSLITPKQEIGSESSSRVQTEKVQDNKVPEETILLIESDDDDYEIKEISDSDSDSDVICISSPSYNPQNTNSRGWYPELHKCLVRTLEKIVDLCDDESDNTKCNIRNRMDLIRESKSAILSRLPSVENVVTSFVVADKMLLPRNSVPKFSEYKTKVNIKADNTRPQSNFSEHSIANYERSQYCGIPNGIDNFNNFINYNSQNPLWAKAEQMQAMAMNMIQTANQLMTVMSTANNNPNELWDLLGNSGNVMIPYNYRPGPTFMHHPRFSGYQRRPYNRPYRPYRRRPWSHRRHFHNAQHGNFAHQRSSVNINPYDNDDDDEVVVLSDGDDVVEVTEGDNHLKSFGKRKNEVLDEVNKRCKVDSDHDGYSEDSSCVMESALDNCKKEPEENNINIKKEINPIVKNELGENNQNATQFLSSDSHSAIISIKSESENSLDSNAFSQNNDKNSCQSPVTEKTQNPIKSSNQTENSSTKQSSNTSNILTNAPITKGSANPEVGKNVTADVNEPCCSSKPAENNTETPTVSGAQEKASELSNANEQSQEITSWEEYKSSSDNVLEEDFGDALIKLDDCISYGNILSSLKIFKKIEAKTQRNHFKITFDVYLPDSHFKKSLKVLPNYRVIVLKPKDDLPTSQDIEGLKISYQDGIPFLFTIVYSDTISFYLYDSVSLNTFCD